MATDAEFLEFHQANPALYRELVRRTRAVIDRGHKGFGFRIIWDSVRADKLYGIKSVDGFRLNDRYTSDYSRLVMTEPGLEGVFEIRAQRSKGKVPKGSGSEGPSTDPNDFYDPGEE